MGSAAAGAAPGVLSDRGRVGDLQSSPVWVATSRQGGQGQAHPGPDALAVEVGPVPDPGVDLEQDGVLPPAGRDLAVLVGVVGVSAVVEAGYNVGQACLSLLHLPLPLAVMFPLILESAAGSCALQDLRDRRRGVRSRALAAGTYLGLGISGAVNGAVGWAAHGAAGLLEVLPPLILGALIHLHGARSERAWRSRAKTRKSWQADQLRQARVDSVGEVLPLLTGDDEDGRATVALLRRRLESGTLTPGEALVAAGWHQRHTREGMTASRVRRLETIAATVWPQGVPASSGPGGASRAGAAAASRPASVRAASPTSAASVVAASAVPAASARGASAPVVSGPDRGGQPVGSPGGDGSVRAATDQEILAAIAQVWSQNPGAGERPVGEHLRSLGLTAAASRLRPLLRRAREETSFEQTAPDPVPGSVVVDVRDRQRVGAGGDGA